MMSDDVRMTIDLTNHNRFRDFYDHVSEEGAVDGEFVGIPIYAADSSMKVWCKIVYQALKIAADNQWKPIDDRPIRAPPTASEAKPYWVGNSTTGEYAFVFEDTRMPMGIFRQLPSHRMLGWRPDVWMPGPAAPTKESTNASSSIIESLPATPIQDSEQSA